VAISTTHLVRNRHDHWKAVAGNPRCEPRLSSWVRVVFQLIIYRVIGMPKAENHFAGCSREQGPSLLVRPASLDHPGRTESRS
jgi:hypothetical protein